MGVTYAPPVLGLYVEKKGDVLVGHLRNHTGNTDQVFSSDLNELMKKVISHTIAQRFLEPNNGDR